MRDTPFSQATKYYEETREKARIHHISSQQSLDKMLLLLITGVFVLSINVVFNNKLHFESVYLLLISWILLGIAIISQILGYILSIRQAENQISELDKWHEENMETIAAVLGGMVSSFNPPRKYSSSIKKSMYVTVTTFILSLIVTLVFSSINFISMNNQQRAGQESNTPDHKGSDNLLPPYVPSAPQSPRQEPAADVSPDNKPSGEPKQ